MNDNKFNENAQTLDELVDEVQKAGLKLNPFLVGVKKYGSIDKYYAAQKKRNKWKELYNRMHALEWELNKMKVLVDSRHVKLNMSKPTKEEKLLFCLIVVCYTVFIVWLYGQVLKW